MVSATRLMSWRTPVSRSGVPILPCRYFEATMFVAVIDQSFGTSTSFCSKMVPPAASEMFAVRSSHSTSLYGETPGLVNTRRTCSPGALRVDCFCCCCCATSLVALSAAFCAALFLVVTSAIVPLLILLFDVAKCGLEPGGQRLRNAAELLVALRVRSARGRAEALHNAAGGLRGRRDPLLELAHDEIALHGVCHHGVADEAVAAEQPLAQRARRREQVAE